MFRLQGDLVSVAGVGWRCHDIGLHVGVEVQGRGPDALRTGSERRAWVHLRGVGPFMALP